MKISVAFNADTRPVCPEFQGLHKGVRSRDFIGRAALENKRRFFDGFDIELIAFIDEHESLTHEQYDTLHELCDCVVVRKHSRYYRGYNPFNAFNDVSYLQCMAMARGDIICHLDQDMFAYRSSRAPIDWMVNEVVSGLHKFVSYPSQNSPAPCHAPEYENKWWISTRFFLCLRESIDFTVLERAIREPQWLYETYDRPPRENPWTEQFLGIMAGYSVIYPPVDLRSWAVFPWMNYADGAIAKLNSMQPEEVFYAIEKAGGPGVFYDGADVNLMGIL